MRHHPFFGPGLALVIWGLSIAAALTLGEIYGVTFSDDALIEQPDGTVQPATPMEEVVIDAAFHQSGQLGIGIALSSLLGVAAGSAARWGLGRSSAARRYAAISALVIAVISLVVTFVVWRSYVTINFDNAGIGPDLDLRFVIVIPGYLVSTSLFWVGLVDWLRRSTSSPTQMVSHVDSNSR